ncbi:MAG: hypothetical protein KAH04_01100 [Psychrilyobacter sp.]|nr:hypothetical protein [Psychrilyobacter sp.]
MEKWMENLTESEVLSIEKVPNHEFYFTYTDTHGVHHLIVEGNRVSSGKEIEIFSNGDYAVTKDFDTWTLYRDEVELCTGTWVTSHTDKSYKYKFYNTSFNKYVVRSVNPDGSHEDEIEGHENHQTEQGDYNVM